MYFESVSAAWEMAGHGPYVWSAYALTFVIIATLVILPIGRARRARAQLQAELNRRQRAQGDTLSASGESHAP